MSIQQLMAESFNEQPKVDVLDGLDEGLENFEIAESLTQADAEMTEAVAVLETAHGVVAGLESLSALAESYIENGGMDAQAAILFNCAVENAMRPFGGETVQALPAQESYSEDGGRLQATQVALEGVQSTLKEVWKTIRNWLQKAQDAVLKWFNENYSQLARMGNAAMKLKQKADEAKGDPDKSKLSVPSAQLFADESGNVTEISPKAIDGVIKAAKMEVADAGEVDKMLREAAGFVTGGEMGKFIESWNKTITAYNEDVTKGAKVWPASDKRRKANDKNTIQVKEIDAGYPGSVCFAISKMVDGSGPVSPVRIDFVKPAKLKEKKNEQDALKQAEVSALAMAISKGCSALQEGKKFLAIIKSEGDALRQAGDLMDKSITGDTSKTDGEAFKKAMNSLSTLANNSRQPLADLAKNSTMILAASYSFAVSSLKNLKEEKKD